MITTNFHTHTVFCDGKSTPEEMVLAAIEKNFVHENCRSLYTVTDDMQKLLEYIEAHVSNDFTVNELKEG